MHTKFLLGVLCTVAGLSMARLLIAPSHNKGVDVERSPVRVATLEKQINSGHDRVEFPLSTSANSKSLRRYKRDVVHPGGNKCPINTDAYLVGSTVKCVDKKTYEDAANDR